ncbi:MAG TPA: hypothetical protein VFF74_05250 [Methylophilaceae bacterium]|nr:hypothetical protein [Methylophilaceae bacterium]
MSEASDRLFWTFWRRWQLSSRIKGIWAISFSVPPIVEALLNWQWWLHDDRLIRRFTHEFVEQDHWMLDTVRQLAMQMRSIDPVRDSAPDRNRHIRSIA